MSNNNNSSGNGVGFLGILTILFIALKLTGHIDWSWWWVLSPIWLGLPIVIILILAVFFVALIIDEMGKK